MSPVNRRSNSADAFLFHGAQKIARIFSAVQSGLSNRSRVKAALKSKSPFLWCVIERAHDEVFTVVSLRTPRQFVVLIREPLHNLRPRDVRIQVRIEGCCENENCEREDQSPKTDSIGPPIKLSM